MGYHIPLFNKITAVRDCQNFAHPVVGHQYSDALAPQAPDYLLDILDGLRIDAGEWFVQKDQQRVTDQAAGEFKAALLTAGQVGDFPVVGRAAEGFHGLLDL